MFFRCPSCQVTFPHQPDAGSAPNHLTAACPLHRGYLGRDGPRRPVHWLPRQVDRGYQIAWRESLLALPWRVGPPILVAPVPAILIFAFPLRDTSHPSFWLLLVPVATVIAAALGYTRARSLAFSPGAVRFHDRLIPRSIVQDVVVSQLSLGNVGLDVVLRGARPTAVKLSSSLQIEDAREIADLIKNTLALPVEPADLGVVLFLNSEERWSAGWAPVQICVDRFAVHINSGKAELTVDSDEIDAITVAETPGTSPFIYQLTATSLSGQTRVLLEDAFPDRLELVAEQIRSRYRLEPSQAIHPLSAHESFEEPAQACVGATR